GEAEAPDELARGRHHVHAITPLVWWPQVDLARVGAKALLAAAPHGRECDVPEDPTVLPPHVLDALLETGRHVDRGVGGEPAPVRHDRGGARGGGGIERPRGGHAQRPPG